MTNSKFEYVKKFEQHDEIIPNMFILVRVDGHGFCDRHNFVKPNDERALNLMNDAARKVAEQFSEIILAYGQSDEYSFVFPPSAKCYNRRASKLSSLISAAFTANYVHSWPLFFPTSPLPLDQPPPYFDGRAVAYPSIEVIRDYLSWRQCDCHINNLYNTTFWVLVDAINAFLQTSSEQPLTSEERKNSPRISELFINRQWKYILKSDPVLPTQSSNKPKRMLQEDEVELILRVLGFDGSLKGEGTSEEQDELRNIVEMSRSQGSTTGFKNEILFRLGQNYNSMPAMFRKGTLIARVRKETVLSAPTAEEQDTKQEERKHNKKQDSTELVQFHEDIIKDHFWNAHPELLGVFQNGIPDPFQTNSLRSKA
ncbi:putative tRNAHis guanylyltransferase [Blattamonas nauphoetae]|uniref:tRNA(His) guanylyltransferase n=1 Tax=Blattamonas nauphoetae TaxID=2049346 RepID=A0ABQ9XFU9_9EUKA|nr:putative tRNAHis guanylyltransferase [Blattamonas nauphoetae]